MEWVEVEIVVVLIVSSCFFEMLSEYEIAYERKLTTR